MQIVSLLPSNVGSCDFNDLFFAAYANRPKIDSPDLAPRAVPPSPTTRRIGMSGGGHVLWIRGPGFASRERRVDGAPEQLHPCPTTSRTGRNGDPKKRFYFAPALSCPITRRTGMKIMDTTGIKSARLAAIEALPTTMQDDALVDWPTVKVLCNFADTEYARQTITKAGAPLVELTPRRKLPRWGATRCRITDCKTVSTLRASLS